MGGLAALRIVLVLVLVLSIRFCVPAEIRLTNEND